MNRNYKYKVSLLVIMILFSFLIPQSVQAADSIQLQTALNALKGYYNQKSVLDDWEALGLRQAGVDCFAKYSGATPSSASDYARTLLGSIAAAKDNATVSGYVYNLQVMQQSGGDFNTPGNTSLNQTIWPLIALDFAAKNGYSALFDRNKAIEYICSHQDAGGGFDESGWGVDVDSTAHAIIALAPYQTQGTAGDAINKALTYLKTQQMDSGLFESWGSGSPDSTAAVIEALKALGKNPQSATEGWKGNMVDALLAYQLDSGPFYAAWDAQKNPNNMTTYNALLAISDLVRGNSKYQNQLPAANGQSANPSDPGTNPNTGAVYNATFSVTGDSSTGIILPATAYSWQNTSTVLDALKKTLDNNAISYVATGGYVKSIGGLSEKQPGYPLSGWLFKVNGSFPGTGADNMILQHGDRVEWVYTMNGGQDLGAAVGLSSENKDEAKMEQQNKEQVTALLGDALSKINSQKEGTLLLNAQNRMTDERAGLLQKELEANKVQISEEAQTQAKTIFDQEKEIILMLPEKALKNTLKISIQEKPKNDAIAAEGFKTVSALYDFGPDGTQFDQAVTIVIRFPVAAKMDINQLAPAYYDTGSKKWVTFPAVIDVEQGRAVFNTTHFSTYAVVEKQASVQNTPAQKKQSVESEPKSSIFADVGAEFAWAKQSIEKLAAMKILCGTDKGFEPARPISRTEMIAILFRAKFNEDYKDIPAEWQTGKVSLMNKARQKGLIAGYPDGSLRPDETINRFECACLLAGMVSRETSPKRLKETVFTDKDAIPAWAHAGVALAANQGFMQGYKDGSFGGDKKLTRAEAAVIIARVLESE